MAILSKISPVYLQLGEIFEELEAAKFLADLDFGADITASFGWYLSPKAVRHLEKKYFPAWLNLKYNQQINWRFERWDGYDNEGVNIKLNI